MGFEYVFVGFVFFSQIMPKYCNFLQKDTLLKIAWTVAVIHLYRLSLLSVKIKHIFFL